ncbi:7913_t:CDS:2, partial [Ambispora gerdemannii]
YQSHTSTKTIFGDGLPDAEKGQQGIPGIVSNTTLNQYRYKFLTIFGEIMWNRG